MSQIWYSTWTTPAVSQEDGCNGCNDCKKQKLLVAEVVALGHTQIVHTATSNGRPMTRGARSLRYSELAPKQTRRSLKAAASRAVAWCLIEDRRIVCARTGLHSSQSLTWGHVRFGCYGLFHVLVNRCDISSHILLPEAICFFGISTTHESNDPQLIFGRTGDT